MGPFTLMDFLGLDVSADVGAYLSSQYGERMHGAEMFERLVKLGRLGEKSGAGFYSYGDQSDEPVKQIIAELSAGKHSEFTPERLIYPMLNEAARCVEESIADTRDIDMAMIAGTGMTYKGDRIGPLALSDKLGLDVIVKGLEAFEAKYGLRFHPCNKLYELVRAGRLGEKTKAGFLEYV
jgi:3-hydroxyacyl-CoA dehydrogenase/enoyl-CoA hydratase/3-hydroxybutyryl-CoA epimerase